MAEPIAHLVNTHRFDHSKTNRIALDCSFDKRLQTAGFHITIGVKGKVGGSIIFADLLQIINYLPPGVFKRYLNRHTWQIVFIQARQLCLGAYKSCKIFNKTANIGDKGLKKILQSLSSGSCLKVDFFVLNENFELFAAHPVRQLIR